MSGTNAEPTRTIALTHAQEMLWTAERLTGAAPIYNMGFAFVIHAPIDPDRFEKSLSLLVDEAETMRTVIEEHHGEPLNRVLPDIEFELPVLDFGNEDDPRAAFVEWAGARIRRPLDVAVAPFDSALAYLDSGTTGWYFSQHHLLADAWGFSVLFRRLSEIYGAIMDGGEPNGDVLESFAEMAGAATAQSGVGSAGHQVSRMQLYGWRHGQPTNTANHRVSVNLGVERTQALHRLLETPGWDSLTKDLGLFRVLGTALFAFLQRITGAEDISIGAPVHNRPSARSRRSPGLFTELFPLSLRLEPADTFLSVHAQLVDETDRFLRSSGTGRSSAAVNRALNVVFNYLPIEFGRFDGASVESCWLHTGHVEAEHQLRVHVADFDSRGSFELLFDCNDEVFGASLRNRVPGHFLAVLDTMISDAAKPIADVVLTGATETSQIMAHSAGPRRPVQGTVVDWIRSQAMQHPRRIAVTDGDRSWTYADLTGRARRVASNLPRSSRVGICLPRSADAVLAMLAILEAGSAYVPIDPSWPSKRIDFVVEDAGCSVVIGKRPEGVSSDIEFVEISGLIAEEDSDPAPVRAGDAAYVLFTSGSTGTPKGVEVTRSSLANYVSWASDFYGWGLVFPLYTSLTFDLTVTSIFVPLCTGGSIRVYGESPGSPDLSVREVLDDDEVDIVKLTPSHLALLVDMDLSSSRVQQLIVGGEDLTVALATRAHECFGGDVLIHNEYGPTEATVGCVVYTFDPETDSRGSVPIGRAIQNMRAVVLGEGGDIVPFGVPGRLWVSGSSVARGYLNRPELTAERFREHSRLVPGTFYDTGDLATAREDGTIEYLGRTDDQVKVRGARVELAEVEAAVASHPNVVSALANIHRRNVLGGRERAFNCLRCGLPDDYPGVTFDTAGICSECRAFEHYRERADVYFKSMSDLEEILSLARETSKADYDCISLLSGGKDSTYALARLVDMGARPLAFTLDNGYISDEAKQNIRRVTEALAVDHVFGSTPAMNQIFVDSLQRHANVCNGCFKTIYTLSMQLARQKGIPLIVTGLSRGQFFESRLTADLFREPDITAEEIDARVLEARKAYHKIDDAPRRLLDVAIFDNGQIFEDVQFADFYRYCDVGLAEILGYLHSRLPWIRPADTGRSTNCLINDVGIFMHKKELGFHNYAHPYSWDVRLGHKTRNEALEELDDEIDSERVQKILDEIGYPVDISSLGDGSQLVAYYTTSQEISAVELRSHVEAQLPTYMVPHRFVRLDEIPTNAHGKADREALPDPTGARPEIETALVPPRTEIERMLAEIWSEVLGVDRVGVLDNFFDLGGDSIAAIRIVSRAKLSGLKVAPKAIFEGQTIAAMADASMPFEMVDSMESDPTEDTPEFTHAGLDDESLSRVAEILSRSTKAGE